MHNFSIAALLALTLAVLTGCGQMGGLYHPSEEDVAEKPAETTDAAPEETGDQAPEAADAR